MEWNLNTILNQIGKDKGIDRTILIEAVESAMLSAARKHFGHNLNLETQFSEDSGEIEVIAFKTVVEKVEDEATQISLADARAEFDAEAIIGDEIGKKLDTTALGRIAAQTAKQVIIQKVRDAERDIIYNEYKTMKGDLINGIVQRYERGNLIINLGRTEAVLPQREQIGRERYRQGDRIRGMILDIDRSAKGPQIILSRSHPDFLKKLFQVEVPEIAENVVEIKAAVREPGERAKIAVVSSDSNIDPVGACVGIKGSRVQAVVQELRGERIDIIPWTTDHPSFVARALASSSNNPVEVVRVVMDQDANSMEVIVPDDQLSLAIGKRGQNVKLASKLTGWKIDVRSVSVSEEETKRARMALEAIPGIGIAHAELLFQNGYRSARDIAEVGIDELAEISGIDAESAKQIMESVNSYIASNPALMDDDGDENKTLPTDLDQLALSTDVKDKLLAYGYRSIQALVVLDADMLTSIPGVSLLEVDKIRQALDTFFAHKPRIMV